MATKKKDELKRSRASQEESLTYEDLTAAGTAPPQKKARTESRTSLFVRSLPASATSESLTAFFSEHFPLKHATVVVDKTTKESRGYGFVTFTDAEDCLAAKSKFNGQLVDGRRIRLEVAEPRHRDAKTRAEAPEAAAKWDAEKERRRLAEEEARKPPKLIIRNLPWSIKKAEDLGKLFLSFGKIRFADLPQHHGKLSGFGFVTLRGRKNAEAAMEALNGKEIDGRTLAVDWAVDKETWEKEKAKEITAEKAEKKAAKEAAKEANEKKDGSKAKKENAKEEQAGEPKETKKSGDFDADADIAAFMEKMNDFDSEPDEGEEDNDDDEVEWKDDEADTSSEEEEEDDDSDKDEDDDAKDSAEESPKPKRTSDNSSTVFIRNVPYTTTDELLKTHFSHFGAIRYARVVVSHTTERSAGTGFVCFFNPDEMKLCVRNAPKPQPLAAKGSTSLKKSILQDESSDPSGLYTLDGRILQVAAAVSKEQATKLSEEGPDLVKKREQDKRRLYLLHEGTISPSSTLYNALNPSEIKMREGSLTQRKKIIQSNPLLHLSLTRLALRNVPHTITSKDLKALAREAIVGFASDVRADLREPLSKEEEYRGGEDDRDAERRRKEKGKGIVKQAKIVFEDAKGSKTAEGKDGVGKSRGYGFIEYTCHRWALMGLRWLNGRAVGGGEGGKGQRLMAEFAIENAQVVARRKDMQTKAIFNAKQTAAGVTTASASSKKGMGEKRERPGGKFQGRESNTGSRFQGRESSGRGQFKGRESGGAGGKFQGRDSSTGSKFQGRPPGAGGKFQGRESNTGGKFQSRESNNGGRFQGKESNNREPRNRDSGTARDVKPPRDGTKEHTQTQKQPKASDKKVVAAVAADDNSKVSRTKDVRHKILSRTKMMRKKKEKLRRVDAAGGD